MIEEIAYAKWPRNVRLANEEMELIITLDVGPRILRCSFHGGLNLFKEYAEQGGGNGEAEWCIRGGHRFWTAPEGEHSYALDNKPVSYRVIGENSIEIESPASAEFGWQKTLQVTLHTGGRATVTHRLKNVSDQPLAMVPWGVTVMAPGGVAVIPQPGFRPHPTEQPPGTPVNLQDFLPNRQVIHWAYTDLCDPRFSFTTDYWYLRQDATRGATKVGFNFAGGWVAYQLGEFIFAKKIPYNPELSYPDSNSNLELFTNRDMLEIESLAPALPLLAGQVHEHVEEWRLIRATSDLRDTSVAKDFFAKLALD